MTDNLPAVNTEQEVLAAFDQGTPMQRLFGATLDRLGGLDFMHDWAEENPDGFMRLLIAVNPPPMIPAQGPAPNTPTGRIDINLHPGLAAGPLDGSAKVVSDQ